MKRRIASIFAAAGLVAFSVVPSVAQGADLAGLVSPLAGSTGAGFPMIGAVAPHAMIQPGPDTALANGTHSPINYDGYAYHDPSISSFSLTHFDGAGIPIAGDLPFTPSTGAFNPSDPLANSSPYDHASEVAEPGYYAVTLDRWQTRVELTSTTRTAMMRLSYPSGQPADLSLSVSSTFGHSGHRGAVQIVGDHELQGYTVPDVGAPLYFTATFDHPFASYGTVSGGAATVGSRLAAGTSAGAYVSFDTAASSVVTMRVAISYVDQAGAANNLATELPARANFDSVRADGRTAWDAALGRATVSGGDQGAQQTFYTNLYRAQLMPSIYDDADGRYRGFDGTVHHVADGSHHLSNLSSWDTYRSQTPLLELIDPATARDLATSLLDDAAERGVIPRWTQSNVDRGIMAGDSGSATLADLVVNGALSKDDVARAWDDLRAQATNLPAADPRGNMPDDLKHGYVPYDHSGIGGSLTLEYAVDDSAVAQVAARLGDAAGATALNARAGFWRNEVDPSTHFLRPRNSDGSWANPTHGFQGGSAPVAAPFSPDFQDGYNEGTGWQWYWAVPQDVAGLQAAVDQGGTGANGRLLRRLDQFLGAALNQPLAPAVSSTQEYGSFFGVYYIGDQYTPANETDLWAPFLYDWLGQPWKTQRAVRAEMGSYSARPDGLPGNDDAGEMSAWYVLAALGLYHAAPGTAAWEIGSPSFATETLNVGGGRKLEIDAPGAGNAKPYVHSATLGDAPLARTYLTTCELESARALSFTLGALPSKWGTGAGAAPPSLSDTSAAAPLSACSGVSTGSSRG